MSTTAGRRSRLVVLPLLAMGAFAAPAQADVSTGRNLEMAHSIEFAVLEGWPLGSTLKVDVLRGTTLIATKTGQVTAGAKPNTTTFEVNHVGGDDCWEVTGGTPDIQPGDKVMATVMDGANPTSDVDFAFVRDIGFDIAPDGTMDGHARGDETAPGVFSLTAPINLTTAIMEAKRVGQGGVEILSTDVQPNGSFRKVLPGTGGEVFIDWVNTTAGGGTETTTTFPDSDLGELPCGPRLTTGLTSNSHPQINIANVGTPMVIGGPRRDGVTVSAAFDGVDLAVDNDTPGTWSASVTTSATLPEGTYSLVASFSDGAPDQTRSIVKDVTAPVVSATRVGDAVALSSNGGEVVRYTTDGTAATSSSRIYDGNRVPLAVGANTIRVLAVDAVGNPTQQAPFTFTVDAPPAQQGPGAGAAAGVAEAVAPAAAVPADSGETTAVGTSATNSLLSLQRLATAARVKRSRARLLGIRLVLDLPAGTEVVKINVYRRTGGTLRLLSSGFKSVGPGRRTVKQSHATLRRLLKIGSYEVQVTPGRSKTDLGKTAKSAFKVVKG